MELTFLSSHAATCLPLPGCFHFSAVLGAWALYPGMTLTSPWAVSGPMSWGLAFIRWSCLWRGDAPVAHFKSSSGLIIKSSLLSLLGGSFASRFLPFLPSPAFQVKPSFLEAPCVCVCFPQWQGNPSFWQWRTSLIDSRAGKQTASVSCHSGLATWASTPVTAVSPALGSWPSVESLQLASLRTGLASRPTLAFPSVDGSSWLSVYQSKMWVLWACLTHLKHTDT